MIGGTSIFGGRGGYVGTIVGALILRVITTMLTLMQIPEGARMVIFGAIVLLRHRRLSPHHRGSLTMVYATADGRAGDRLRVGMVGGGRNAFIGAVHRLAMRLDDQIALVAGALSSDPENAAASAAEIGIARRPQLCRLPRDGRGRGQARGRHRGGRHRHAQPSACADRDRVPGGRHRRHLRQAAGDERCRGRGAGRAERRSSTASSLVTLNNTGYAMVRQAREMVAAGELGPLRAIHASYIQDWLTLPIDADGNKQAEWRTDPARAGESAVLADIGVHAYNLASFISGATAETVSADLFTAVPGRRLDDNAHVLVRWTGGARGTVDREPDLARPLQRPRRPRVRRQGRPRMDRRRGPEELRFSRYGEESAHASSAAATARRREPQRVSRMPAAHPEGYIEAFANYYRDAADDHPRPPHRQRRRPGDRGARARRRSTARAA